MHGFTVIIPAYNAAATVARAVASAATQAQITQVTVIDDGSTDSTAATAERTGAAVLRRDNAGPAAARNAGLTTAASGTHALFLDADDELAPGATDAIAAVLASHPDAAAVVGSHLEKNPGSISHAGRLRTPDPEWTAAGVLPGPALALGTGHVFCTTGITLTRRSIDAGICFDERLWFGEDRDLVYRAGALGPVAVTDATIVLKHAHAGRLTDDPRKARRWLRDQILLLDLHAPPGCDPVVLSALHSAAAWTLRNTLRSLARRGLTLPADEWTAARGAFEARGWPLPLAVRRWWLLGAARSRLAAFSPRPGSRA